MTWALIPLSIGLAIGSLSLLSAALFRRRLTPPATAPEACVTLVMALTGDAPRLPPLLRAIAGQTLRPRRLIVAVESARDPAHQAVLDASRQCPVPLELIVAGLADRAGQKCFNLAAALDRIDAHDQIVVFLDADIMPQTWWLAALAAPLLTGACGIVTGYRWPIIERDTLGAHAVLAIDRGIAVLPRFRWTQAVWGGSVAMRRETVDQLGLRERFRESLSDDLTIGSLARRAGISVLYRRVLRVPSPLGYDLRAAWRFGQRQYQLVRLYHRPLWFFALATTALQLACWMSIALNIDQSRAAQAGAATLLAMALTKQWLLNSIGETLGHRAPPSTVARQLLLCFAKPVLDMFHLTMVVAAARTGTVTWAHIAYHVRGPRAISVVSRAPWSSSAP